MSAFQAAVLLELDAEDVAYTICCLLTSNTAVQIQTRLHYCRTYNFPSFLSIFVSKLS